MQGEASMCWNFGKTGIKKKKKKECGVGNKPSSLFIDNISVKKYI